MKTSLLNSRTGMLAVILATAMAADAVRAEDEGVVRLGSRTANSTSALEADGRVVARGQSDLHQPVSQPKPGLLQLLSAHDECAADDCASCCPDSCCADSCCAADSCDGCGAAGGDGCGKVGLFQGLHGRNGKCCGRCSCANCGGPGCGCGCGCSSCGSCGQGFLARQCAIHNARKQANNAQLNQYLRCKLGYFIPDGCGGVGCKPFGCYSIVYPDNPAHFDGRDGQVYAAQGVGGPVSVPVAPNVRHAYNYGWGIPSSRLTPISNAAY
ncbi:MAG: hypothetical protein AB7U20_09955 [Planctomycetaceae bacterium]